MTAIPTLWLVLIILFFVQTGRAEAMLSLWFKTAKSKSNTGLSKNTGTTSGTRSSSPTSQPSTGGRTITPLKER